MGMGERRLRLKRAVTSLSGFEVDPFEKGLHVLRWDQANVVPELLSLAPNVMRARAGLQADKAGRQIDKPAYKLVARYLDAHGDGATLIESDEVKFVLADIEADRRDRIG
jgi:hypothetical protein